MCGIVYVRRNDNKCAIRPTIKRYEFQKDRGRQGFGYVAASGNKIVSYERDETEEGILKKMKDLHTASVEAGITIDEILYHHRFPTSTPNTENTAHPIHVSNPILKYDYYVVHNGVVTNPTMLRDKHDLFSFEYTTEVECVSYQRVKYGKDGRKLPKHKRITEEIISTKFNDSEALAIELALWNENIIHEVRATGSYAFIIWQVDKDTKNIVAMSYGRKSSPLKIDKSFELSAITSLNPSKDIDDIATGIMYTATRDEYGNITGTSERRFEIEYPSRAIGFHTGNSGYSSVANQDFAPGYGGNIIKRRCDTCLEDYRLSKFPSETEPYTCAYCISGKLFDNSDDSSYSRTCYNNFRNIGSTDDEDDEVVGRAVENIKDADGRCIYTYNAETKSLEYLNDNAKTSILSTKEQELLEEWYEVDEEITFNEEMIESLDKQKDANEYWETWAALDALRQRKIEIELEIDIEEYTV